MNRIIVDVREPLEYKIGHVKGAINIPPSQMMSGAEKLDGVPKDTELVLYCVSGSRSNSSMHYLRQLGFTNLVNGINKSHVEAKYL
ncbi:MAG: rhodanese-like domain-containing protein [Candidatus Microsaccharimonas sp.]